MTVIGALRVADHSKARRQDLKTYRTRFRHTKYRDDICIVKGVVKVDTNLEKGKQI